MTFSKLLSSYVHHPFPLINDALVCGVYYQIVLLSYHQDSLRSVVLNFPSDMRC